MSEHNLFLGTARKSVGDVTLMRRAGRQLARVRLRTISNPKTEAQAIQRNFVAPVARFYAPLRKVLARSFEGLNKDQSYNKFQKVNIDLARKGQWFLPKGAPWQPLPYQLSRGSLKPYPYTLQNSNAASLLIFLDNFPDDDDLTCANVSYWLNQKGFKEGDVFTLICVGVDSDGQYQPYTAQFTLNMNDRRYMTAFMGDTIDMYTSSVGLMVRLNGLIMVAASVLYARRQDGMWKRSSQFLTCANFYLQTLVSQEARDASIASYQTPNSDDGGGVYPGGDDNLFNVSAMDGRALLFVGGEFTAQTDGAAGNPPIMLKPDNFDRYYYIKLGTNRYVGTNSEGSLQPSDWRGVGVTPAPADNSNTIEAPAGSQMATYLASIGFEV